MEDLFFPIFWRVFFPDSADDYGILRQEKKGILKKINI